MTYDFHDHHLPEAFPELRSQEEIDAMLLRSVWAKRREAVLVPLLAVVAIVVALGAVAWFGQ